MSKTQAKTPAQIKTQTKTAADLLGEAKISLPKIGQMVKIHLVIDDKKVVHPALVMGIINESGVLDLNVFMKGHIVFSRAVYGTDNTCWSY